MSQLCLYLDDETMELLQAQAARRNTSLSKCASECIRAQAQPAGWPGYFLDLYGSIDDPAFERPDQGDPGLDDDPAGFFTDARKVQ